MTDPKDEAASEFEEAYEEFRHKHINASFMPKEMAKFMFLAGRASKEIRLPSDESIMSVVDKFGVAGNLFDFLKWYSEQIKALNEGEGDGK